MSEGMHIGNSIPLFLKLVSACVPVSHVTEQISAALKFGQTGRQPIGLYSINAVAHINKHEPCAFAIVIVVHVATIRPDQTTSYEWFQFVREGLIYTDAEDITSPDIGRHVRRVRSNMRSVGTASPRDPNSHLAPREPFYGCAIVYCAQDDAHATLASRPNCQLSAHISNPLFNAKITRTRVTCAHTHNAGTGMRVRAATRSFRSRSVSARHFSCGRAAITHSARWQ